MTRFEFLCARFRDRPSRLASAVRSALAGWFSPRYRRPVVSLYAGSATSRALGDNLMLTTVAREVKKRNPRARVEVLTNAPEIFARNPDVDAVRSRAEASPSRDCFISYSQGFPYRQHFLQYCCEGVNITGPIDLRTYIYPAPEDFTWADEVVSRLSGPPLLLNRQAGSAVFRKTWPLASWQALGARLAGSGPIIDVGTDGEPLPDAAGDYQCLSGHTTVHQLAALMSKSRALISVDSGPLHLAAAYDLPAVCLLGGVYPAEAIRYPKSIILTDRPPCADCAPQRHCDFQAKCLSNISVETVLSALDDLGLDLRAVPSPDRGRSTFNAQSFQVPATLLARTPSPRA